MSMERMFYPRGVAVVGSVAEGKLGYVLINQLLKGGFRSVFAVNPKGQGLEEVPGYEKVTHIDAPVDLAVIASPAPTVAAVLEDCGQAGVGAAVIITAGFSEVGNHAGEQELKQVAQRYGIRFVGPNCAGILNTHHHLFPTLEVHPPAGYTAFISQSGALGGAVLAWAEEQGLGFSKFVSYGNGADLDEVELLRYLMEDPDTRVGALYLESVRYGRAFMQAVADFTRRKPLVVIKAGRSGAGRRAALSHTGSMAGSDAVYDAALRQSGAIRVDTVEEMFDLCKGFSYLPPVRGRRVVIVTNSGGPGVMAADRAEQVGLQVAEPSPAARQQLASFLPAHCALKNPIDLTVEGTEEGYHRVLTTVLPEYDAALALNVCPPYLDSLPIARGVCRAARQSGKPVVANFMAGSTVAASLPYLREQGIPNFVTGERAMSVLARLADYYTRPVSPAAAAGGAAELSSLPMLPRPVTEERPILEPEAMDWLRRVGIPTPDFRFVADPDGVLAACHEIGYPVVMKVVASDIVHKSDCGGVVLNIQDDEAALTAYAAIQRAAQGKDLRGVMIYPMLRGGQEVLIGLSRDAQFGPVIAFGAGGIYTELWHDIVLRVAPLGRSEAEAMLREARCFALLQGFRGQPRRDVPALAELLVTVSRLALHYPEIAELDLNPVFVFERGLQVGDVRILTQSRS